MTTNEYILRSDRNRAIRFLYLAKKDYLEACLREDAEEVALSFLMSLFPEDVVKEAFYQGNLPEDFRLDLPEFPAT